MTPKNGESVKNEQQSTPLIRVGAGQWEKGCDSASPCLLLAHGAGAGMDSDFMSYVATGLAKLGIRVYRFEFPYMQVRRQTGSKRPPDRAPKLLEHFAQEINALEGPVVIGGKSMGGRMASMLAAQADEVLASRIKGVVALGYPFHPAGKPENLRIDHLPKLSAPMLVVQGTRDKLGDVDLISALELPNSIAIHWCEDGDHDLKPRKSSGFSHEQHLTGAIEQVAKFVQACVATSKIG